MNIRQMTAALRKAREAEGFCTLLGIGPMSPMLVQATLELSMEQDFPVMFIASRNQVDLDELGGGYVSNWDQYRLVRDIRAAADKIGYTGQYYICRDHGGPWQRDEERRAALPEHEAMAIGLKSYLADVDAGFDLLHIDPTKDPHIEGTVPMELVLERTVALIEAVEKYIREKNLPAIGYEVGTEETNGGLTGTAEYSLFIEKLCAMLTEKGLPTPDFIVGQTGTLVRMTENVGHFSMENAGLLSAAAAGYHMELKEHNSDYLDDEVLLLHPAMGVGSSNVAPEYGTCETRAYLTLARLEQTLAAKGVIGETGNVLTVLPRAAINTGRWRKWMVGEDGKLTAEEVLARPELTAQITDIAGHYTFETPEVAAELTAMLDRLEKANVPARRYVIDRVKRRIADYVTCYNLRGLTAKLRKYAE